MNCSASDILKFALRQFEWLRGDLIVDPEFSLAHEASDLLTLASKYDCCFYHGLMRHVIEDDCISNREFAGKREIAADIAC